MNSYIAAYNRLVLSCTITTPLWYTALKMAERAMMFKVIDPEESTDLPAAFIKYIQELNKTTARRIDKHLTILQKAKCMAITGRQL